MSELVFRGMFVSWTSAAGVISGVARSAPGDQSFLKGLIEAGKLKTGIEGRKGGG
ncbi:MAG: hypothetical protein ABI682_04405 [Acidobacteriota bacterium]